MSTEERLHALKHLATNYPISKDGDIISIDARVSEETIGLINDFQSKGIEFYSFQINSISKGFNELSLFIDEIVKIELSLSQLKGCGLNIYWDWGDFLKFKPNLFSLPSSFLIISDLSEYPSTHIDGRVKHYP